MTPVRCVVLALLACGVPIAHASAQSPGGSGSPPASQAPRASVDVTAGGGYAAFVDDGRISHGVFSAGLEWLPTRHLAIGPEVQGMVGPGSDRDLLVLGVVRIGILPLTSRVAPFVTLGAGTMTHWDSFGGRSFRSTEGAFVAGGGVRVWVSPRVFVAPEVTIGWEPHVRSSIVVGVTM